MPKVKITVATIGYMPPDFDIAKLKSWKSSVFEVVDAIENYSINQESDGSSWEYSDVAMTNLLPSQFYGDFLISIVNVPIQLNWYSRRIGSNRIVFSFHEIKEILRSSNIPLENAVYRIFYAHTLLYKRSGDRIPEIFESTFTHDDTRGCIFDMNGIKSDLVYSCHKPIICPGCVEQLRSSKVSNHLIEACQIEIHKIQRPFFTRISDFIKRHPLWSLVISSVTAIVLGAIGSIIASYLYDFLK